MSTGATATGFELTVSVQDAVDLYAYQFTLNFDPSLLSAVDATEGAFLPGEGPTFFFPGDIDQAAGSVSFVFGTLLGAVEGADGSGDLVTFSFTTLSSGFARFSLSDVVLLDASGSDIAVDTRDVVAQVAEPSSVLLAAWALLAAVGRRKSARTAV